MKRIGLLLLFVWRAVAAFGQTDNYRDAADAALINLDRQFVTSRILYDRAFPLANLNEFKATDLSSATHFLQARSELYNAAYDPAGQQTSDDLERNIWRSQQQRIVPIGITLVRFEKVVPEAVELDPVTNSYQPAPGGTQQKANGDVFTTANITLVSPLVPSIPFGVSTFSLPSWAVFNNLSSIGINSVQVDFGDGNPLKTMTVDGGTVQVTYNTPGEKTVRFTIQLSNGTQQTAAAQFTVTSAVVFGYPRNDGISDIDSLRFQSTIAFSGYSGYESPCPNGQGDVLTYYATGPANQRILRKPIIFLDGFDAGDTRAGSEIYEKRLVYNNGVNRLLGVELRNSGYDVIILNFPKYECGGQVRDGGADYIERNAMVLVALINQINAKLQQNGSTEKLIVVGPSMGGLISRYALRYMELNSLNHNCKLWVSFDSPHHGANISIGLQYFFRSLSDLQRSARETLRDKIDSPAARQMLLHHHLAGSLLPTGAPNFRDRFIQTMNTFGFPQASCLRKVSLSNGSKYFEQGGYPCSDALNVYAKPTKVSPIKALDAFVKFAPDVNADCAVAITKFSIPVTLFLPYPRFNYTVSYTARGMANIGKLDQLPGGYYQVFEETAKEARSESFFGYTVANTFFPNMTFIPTVSSLALYNKDRNWSGDLSYINRQNGNVSTLTPFDDVYMPDANEDHTSLTSASVQFVLEQIAQANLQQCGTPPPPTGGAFAVQNPQYNCQTGQLLMQTSGGDGSTIEYQVAGLRGWGTDPNFTVPAWQLQGTAFNLQARQSGNAQMLSFTSSCTGPPPPPPPPTGGALALTEPTFSCATGDLTLNTSGGNGSALEYQIVGIRGWGSGATMNVPTWQRNGVAFTLQARQSGTEAPSRIFTASCGGGRLASVVEETVRLSVSPNPSRGVVRVRYWLAARQAGQLRVVSAMGAVLSEQTVVGTGQTEETTLSLEAHPAGMYLINLSSGTVHETAKVLLQR